MMKENVLEALRCCREGACERCPLQGEICDDLRVDMEDVPTELLDLIEKTLESK